MLYVNLTGFIIAQKRWNNSKISLYIESSISLTVISVHLFVIWSTCIYICIVQYRSFCETLSKNLDVLTVAPTWLVLSISFLYGIFAPENAVNFINANVNCIQKWLALKSECIATAQGTMTWAEIEAFFSNLPDCTACVPNWYSPICMFKMSEIVLCLCTA